MLAYWKGITILVKEEQKAKASFPIVELLVQHDDNSTLSSEEHP